MINRYQAEQMAGEIQKEIEALKNEVMQTVEPPRKLQDRLIGARRLLWGADFSCLDEAGVEAAK